MMAIEITTDEQYRAALAEADSLMDSAPDSPEEDRLGELADAIVAYENRVYGLVTTGRLVADSVDTDKRNQ